MPNLVRKKDDADRTQSGIGAPGIGYEAVSGRVHIGPILQKVGGIP